jgi:pimeloyl-ACP methyl ester carboxylesterase
MPYATARDGTNIYYKDWGSGTPVVLVHGWPLSSDTFDDAALHLADNGFRVIFHDRRGFGRSDQPWTGYDYDTFADDVSSVLDQAGISEPVAIAGFSMGPAPDRGSSQWSAKVRVRRFGRGHPQGPRRLLPRLLQDLLWGWRDQEPGE